MLGGDIGVEPVADRRQRRVARSRSSRPHMRGWKRLVALLAVALPQPAEDAEDARVALRRERPIGALERLAGPVAAT